MKTLIFPHFFKRPHFFLLIHFLIWQSPLLSYKVYSPTGKEFLKSATTVLMGVSNFSYNSNMRGEISLKLDDAGIQSLVHFSDSTPLFDSELWLLDVPVKFDPLFLDRTIRPQYYPTPIQPSSYYGVLAEFTIKSLETSFYYSIQDSTAKGNKKNKFFDNPNFTYSNSLSANKQNKGDNFMLAARTSLSLPSWNLSVQTLRHYHRDRQLTNYINVFQPSANLHKNLILTLNTSSLVLLEKIYVDYGEGYIDETALHIMLQNGRLKKLNLPQTSSVYAIYSTNGGQINYQISIKKPFSTNTNLNFEKPIKKVKIVYAGEVTLYAGVGSSVNTPESSITTASSALQKFTSAEGRFDFNINNFLKMPATQQQTFFNLYRQAYEIETDHLMNDFIGFEFTHKGKYARTQINLAMLQKNNCETIHTAMKINSFARFGNFHFEGGLKTSSPKFTPSLQGDESVLANAPLSTSTAIFSPSDHFSHLYDYRSIADAFFNYYISPPEGTIYGVNDNNNNGVPDLHNGQNKLLSHRSLLNGQSRLRSEISYLPSGYLSSFGGFGTFFDLLYTKKEFITSSVLLFESTPKIKKNLPKSKISIYLPRKEDNMLGSLQNSFFMTPRFSQNISSSVLITHKYFFIPDKILNHSVGISDVEILFQNKNIITIYSDFFIKLPFFELMPTVKTTLRNNIHNKNYFDFYPSFTVSKKLNFKDLFFVTPALKSFLNISHAPFQSLPKNNSLQDYFRKTENYNIALLETELIYRPFVWNNSLEYTHYNAINYNNLLYEYSSPLNYERRSFLSRIEYIGKYLGRSHGLSLTFTLTQIDWKKDPTEFYTSLVLDLHLGF